jgi:hypothetical protein
MDANDRKIPLIFAESFGKIEIADHFDGTVEKLDMFDLS